MIQGPKKSRNVTMLIWVLTPVNFDYNFAVEVKFSPTVTVCLLIIILKMYNVNKNIKKNIFCSRIQNLHTVHCTGQDRTHIWKNVVVITGSATLLLGPNVQTMSYILNMLSQWWLVCVCVCCWKASVAAPELMYIRVCHTVNA